MLELLDNNFSYFDPTVPVAGRKQGNGLFHCDYSLVDGAIRTELLGPHCQVGSDRRRRSDSIVNLTSDTSIERCPVSNPFRTIQCVQCTSVRDRGGVHAVVEPNLKHYVSAIDGLMRQLVTSGAVLNHSYY